MLRLLAFGGLRLDSLDPASPAPPLRRRSLALLALVAAAGDAGVSRERILGVLWPDTPEEQGRHALSQALYALRKELKGADPLAAAGVGMRLRPGVMASDVDDFLRAHRTGDHRAMLEVYAGPFLDGVYVPQSGDFDRWVDEERARLAGLYAAALEHEADRRERAGEPAGAAELWRRVVALDPLAAKPRMRLMHALEAAGERAAALEEGRRHRDLLARELGAEPDPGVAALDAALRRAPLQPPAGPPGTTPIATGSRTSPLRDALVAVALLAGVVTVGLLARPHARAPVVAVGVVESHLAADSVGLARSLGDLLATHLVQVPSLRVVARTRLLAVLGEEGRQPGPGGVARAARLAGAEELVEGVLYDDAAGYRLDLRRSGLQDGAMHGAVSVTAPDPVALVENAVAALAGTWGLEPPARSLRAATSVSLAARRYYDDGLRTFFAGDRRSAARLFELALTDDPTFAMAAYFRARSGSEAEARTAWARALALAAGATDRERLLILARGSLELNDARGLAYAETLAVRYPDELDGVFVLGELRFALGDFAGALAAFDRVISRDSAGRTGQAASCHACDAAVAAVWVALTADSLPRAEHLARRMAAWPGGQVSSPALLATVLARAGRTGEALAAARLAARHERTVSVEAVEFDGLQREGHLPRLDSILTRQLAAARLPEVRGPILERLARIRREGGRPRSALALALEREGQETPEVLSSAPFVFLERALSLHELGRHDPARARQAAALFDSMAAMPAYDEVRMARHRAWLWTHVARALALAGDTAPLPALESRIASMAARSSYGRDRRLRYVVRGLLAESRGDWEEAWQSYAAASWSPTESVVAPSLARMALRTGRPAEAARILEGWLRGPLDAANQYVPRWEVHRLLADAYRALGEGGRAELHEAWVRRALAGAEADYTGMRGARAAGRTATRPDSSS